MKEDERWSKVNQSMRTHKMNNWSEVPVYTWPKRNTDVGVECPSRESKRVHIGVTGGQVERMYGTRHSSHVVTCTTKEMVVTTTGNSSGSFEDEYEV